MPAEHLQPAAVIETDVEKSRLIDEVALLLLIYCGCFRPTKS